MKIYHTLFGLLIFTLSAKSLADAYIDTTVKQINGGYADGNIYFKVNDTPVNPANCESSSYYAIDTKTNDKESALSLLLSAKMTNAQISLRVSSLDCVSKYPKVVTTILK